MLLLHNKPIPLVIKKVVIDYFLCLQETGQRARKFLGYYEGFSHYEDG